MMNITNKKTIKSEFPSQENSITKADKKLHHNKHSPQELSNKSPLGKAEEEKMRFNNNITQRNQMYERLQKEKDNFDFIKTLLKLKGKNADINKSERREKCQNERKTPEKKQYLLGDSYRCSQMNNIPSVNNTQTPKPKSINAIIVKNNNNNKINNNSNSNNILDDTKKKNVYSNGQKVKIKRENKKQDSIASLLSQKVNHNKILSGSFVEKLQKVSSIKLCKTKLFQSNHKKLSQKKMINKNILHGIKNKNFNKIINNIVHIKEKNEINSENTINTDSHRRQKSAQVKIPIAVIDLFEEEENFEEIMDKEIKKYYNYHQALSINSNSNTIDNNNYSLIKKVQIKQIEIIKQKNDDNSFKGKNCIEN